MPSLWMLAQWRYPGHLNTQGSPPVIVNQIMIPWLHCTVISVTQPFRYILYRAVTNLEAVLLFFCFFFPKYRNSIRYCVSYIFFSFLHLSLRALSGRHGTLSGWMSARSSILFRYVGTVSPGPFCLWQSGMPSTPCLTTLQINSMLWKRYAGSAVEADTASLFLNAA